MVKGMLWTVVIIIGILLIVQIKSIITAVIGIINIPFMVGKLNEEGKVTYLANVTADIIWYGVFIFIFVICLKLALAKDKNKKG